MFVQAYVCIKHAQTDPVLDEHLNVQTHKIGYTHKLRKQIPILPFFKGLCTTRTIVLPYRMPVLKYNPIALARTLWFCNKSLCNRTMFPCWVLEA